MANAGWFKFAGWQWNVIEVSEWAGRRVREEWP
jgi:hypothetical protein